MRELSSEEPLRTNGWLLPTLLFLVPAGLILWKSIPLLLYQNTIEERWLTTYFIYGGHVVTLLACFFLAVFVLKQWGPPSVSVRRGILGFLAAIYLIVSGMAWLCVAAGVMSF
ncbi:MAG: hypothetical protein P1U85_01880 [Verrucomicrobiales bacterium]|nr:hypothetical protein [Verrucomicrobiales bacterium]